MNNKKIILGIILISSMILTLVSVNGIGPIAHAKTKKIKLLVGETYKLKVKSGSEIKCSNKKAAKITKKGKVTALCKGKCIITISKGKKTVKYKFIIKAKKKNSDIELEPTVAPTVTPTETPISIPIAGAIAYKDLIIDRIETVDEISSYVYFVRDPNTIDSDVLGESTIKYSRIQVSNDKLKSSGYTVGDKVGFIMHQYCKTEVVGDTIIYKDLDGCSLHSYK